MSRHPWVRLLRAGLLFCLCWPALVSGAQAAPLRHPAPSVLHDYVLSLTERELTLVSYLRVSPELAPEIYRQIDADNDGRTSDPDRDAWFRKHPASLRLALDGVEMQPQLSPAPGLSKEDLLVSIDHPIVVTYTAALVAPASGKHKIRITYGDNYLSYDEYYLSVAGDLANEGKAQPISQPQYPATYQVVYHMPTPADDKNILPKGGLAPAPWTGGPPQQSSNADTDPNANSPTAGSLPGQILDNLRGWRGEFWSALGMLALALFVGALHALSPGHGKSLMAAYLVGSRGRVRDAALLGGVVTFSHTAVVIAVGLALLATSTAMPPSVLSGIELVAGLFVLGLGARLLVMRWREIRSQKSEVRSQKSEVRSQEEVGTGLRARPADGGPDGEELVQVGVARALTATASATSTLTMQRTQDATERQNGTSSHTHDPQGHSHDHDHEHDHGHHDPSGHSHDGHYHTHPRVSGSLGAKALIGLGITGGIIPCPEALAIILLAASVGQFGLGLGLVLSFSLGLAAVLIGIGVALVKVKGLANRKQAAWTAWAPLASAAVIIIIGAGMVVSALGSRWG